MGGCVHIARSLVCIGIVSQTHGPEHARGLVGNTRTVQLTLEADCFVRDILVSFYARTARDVLCLFCCVVSHAPYKLVVTLTINTCNRGTTVGVARHVVGRQ